MSDKVMVKQVMVGAMANYAYIIKDMDTGKGVIIDPGWDTGRLISICKGNNIDVQAVLATHSHFDHINDAYTIVREFDADFYIHSSEVGQVKEIDRKKIITVEDGSEIKIGSLVIKVMHTPGHSPGSVCYILDNNVFTGDTLFIDAIGRTDLEGGDVHQMFESLGKIRKLSNNMMLYPGHEYGPKPFATVEEQKRTNPYLKAGEL